MTTPNEAALAKQDWQPIATVPHDFSQVILSNGEWVRFGNVGRENEYEPLIADTYDSYGEYKEYWLDIGKGAEPYADQWADMILPDRPTHWMPLPDPPLSEGE